MSTSSPTKSECAPNNNDRLESGERAMSCTDSLRRFGYQTQISGGEREDSLSSDGEERTMTQQDQGTISKSVVISVQ